ncbi:DUF6442 family protein [Clostridium beijerinckii]|jgi:uncharacterized protein YfeS|uniref:Uncharacterized protein n=2 Tax=Clostridium beijerinckii TaxID=1520 RepID=A0AAE2RQF9_CLOBE|nr:DUF6442 family protein [Clostridium beijerinckii]ABR35582.1 hypothetical protein Cbei_3457 [Clostridium beijerinckii NCIMB 8052]AIU05094.1 hypothetical protein Cbs_3457 [Clostridium beijerinckii ATCC 35702]MBF7809780.1 hypothetical protein [Clostridium beijerinckii]NRT69439.1 uncharacterized protein YfeS [Clostridium beijerinckii]NRT84413.1 uncharacterized protein YfeS [Clostridium beijerinckii]
MQRKLGKNIDNKTWHDITKIPSVLVKELKGGIYMNRDEILARSKKENLLNDERERYIQKSANQNSYFAVIIIFAIFSIILFIQKLITGGAFADYRVFSLALLIAMIGQSGTVYYYNREKKVYLVCTILGIIGAIAGMASIVGSGMGWF